MQLNGLWLQENGRLLKECTMSQFPREKAVSWKRREEQLSDSDQSTDSDGDEHLLDDDTEQLGDEDDSLAEDGTQLHGNNQNEQDLRARDCTRIDSYPPTDFESEDDIDCVEKKADNFMESLNKSHKKGTSKNSNVSSNAEVHSVIESLTVKHGLQEDDKAIGSQEILNHVKKRVLKEDEPERKPKKIKKRKLLTFRHNPFMAKLVVLQL